MKTYRETLNKMKENDLSAGQAMVAAEVDGYTTKSEEEFEIICSWCYGYIMDTDATDVSWIVSRIFYGLTSGDITIENLRNNDTICEIFVEDFLDNDKY